jgi:hypothetical protein
MRAHRVVWVGGLIPRSFGDCDSKIAELLLLLPG